MTSRSLFGAVAVATVLSLAAGPPAPAVAAVSRPATRTAQVNALGKTISAVRDTVELDRIKLATARREFAAATAAHARELARLRADVALRASLLERMHAGAAALYMMHRAEDPVPLIAQLRALKDRIPAETASTSAARARMLAAAATVRRTLALYKAAAARFRALQAQAARLGVRFVPSRVAARVSRSGRRYICPVAGPVRFSDDFGERRGTGRHSGVDMLSDAGTPTVAIFAGQIVNLPSGYEGSAYGNLMILRDTAGNEWWYAHLSAKLARVGQRVEAGQVIGRVGCTGRCSGPHLHFELHPKGREAAVDPYSFLAEAC